MTKSQSGQAFNTASGQQATAGQNAQSSYTAATGDIGNFEKSLGEFQSQNPFVQGGSFQTANNQQIADTAAANAAAGQQAMTGASVRGGLNPTAATAAGEQAAEQNARSEMSSEAAANQAQAAGLAGYNTTALHAAAQPAQMETALTGQQIASQNAGLSAENQAAQTPSFWQELGAASLQAGVDYAGAACPAEGSLYLMADGSEQPVETLKVGDQLRGVDGDMETVLWIASVLSDIVRVETSRRLVQRCSHTHSFIAPRGGFVEAANARGKQVETDAGADLVISVTPDGKARVFNVVTDGSHTYQSNGIWSLGVGEAEMLAATGHSTAGEAR